MKLSFDKIRLDGGTQPRAELLLDVIHEYAEQMLNGAEFPPVVVFFDGNDYWLADGFHRLNAARETCPEKSVEVEVHQGTQSDAQWYSYSVNKAHGLRRTKEDRIRAIKAALRHPEGATRSDNQIAKHVGVNDKTVAKYRAQLELSSEIPKMRERSVKRNGKTYKQDVSQIGRSKPADRSPSKLKVHRPIRAPCPVEKLTTVNLPHNPVMGARTLLEVFPADYLKTLVEELQQALQIS